MIKVIEECRLTIAFIAQGCALAMAEMVKNEPDKYEALTDGLGQTGVMDMVTQHYWRIDELWKRVNTDEMCCIWDYDVSEEFGKTFTIALSEPDCPNSLHDGTGVDEFIMSIVKALEAEELLSLNAPEPQQKPDIRTEAMARLILAAQQREHHMGDPIALLNAKAELQSAAKRAQEVL